MKNRFVERKLGLSVALFAGMVSLATSLLGLSGFYLGAREMMKNWQEYYSFTLLGSLTGALEVALWGYVFGWLTAVFYNSFTFSSSGD